jgi:hypothetical protein
MDSFPRNSIKQDFRSARLQNTFDPRNPLMPKTFNFQNIQNGVMLNFVKSFLKIKFQDDNFFLKMVAQVKVFKSLGNAILDGSTFNETILVLVDDRNSQLLKPISKEFGDKLHRGVKERDGSVIRDTDRALNFRNQSDKG